MRSALGHIALTLIFVGMFPMTLCLWLLMIPFAGVRWDFWPWVYTLGYTEDPQRA